ncbi:MAG: hypothetical protein FIA99_08505 [Ruminiclostridium sp.]|nr:hypothetical protein [Ruminiclostridium sp.]
MNEVVNWLLNSDPWVEYNTRVDLLGQSEQEPVVAVARKHMLEHPQIKGLLNETSCWRDQIVNGHKNAALPLHKLAFLADLGFTINDDKIAKIVDLILDHKDVNCVPQVLMNIPAHFGGTGENTWSWALCDAPIILYSLAKFGGGDNQSVKNGIKYLTSLIRENGWPCAVSYELRKFRGPGRKDDPCPYSTLIMLKLLSEVPELEDSDESHTGAEVLLNLWVKSRETHPYMFYMGTDFRKLKAPLMWYDILNVVETLSHFNWLHNDSRLIEMARLVELKADADGLYTPESEYKAWKGWDFGQKKVPSTWLTFIVLRMLERIRISAAPHSEQQYRT